MSAGPRWRVETLLVVALFLVVGLIGAANHEMWRDELEIWLIARDSASLPELFRNMGTEGHPALWYLLNFALTRFTSDPRAMQWLSLAIGAAAAGLFFARAPFRPAQRVLFCFGYFLLYEFTVISRSYGLGLLLAFAFCARRARVRGLDPLGAALLFLLANTHLYGTIAAAAIVLFEALRALGAWRATARRPEARAWLALAIVALGALVGLGHTWMQARAIGPAHAGAYAPARDLTWVARCLSTPFRGAAPVPDLRVDHFWNSNLLDALPAPAGPLLGALLSGALLLAATADLRRRGPALASVFLCGTAAMLVITFLVWFGSNRHHGQVFLWYLVCAWIGATLLPGTPPPAPPRRRPWLTAVLAAQVLAGGWAYGMDLARPFSSARATGHYLRAPEFDDVALVGSVDYAVQPIAAFMPRRFFYPESGRRGTFLDWGPSRTIVGPDEVLRRAAALSRAEGRDAVIVFSYAPGGMEPGEVRAVGPDLRLLCFARFGGAIVADENYHLCRLTRTPGAPGPDGVDSPPARDDNDDRGAR